MGLSWVTFLFPSDEADDEENETDDSGEAHSLTQKTAHTKIHEYGVQH